MGERHGGGAEAQGWTHSARGSNPSPPPKTNKKPLNPQTTHHHHLTPPSPVLGHLFLLNFLEAAPGTLLGVRPPPNVTLSLGWRKGQVQTEAEAAPLPSSPTCPGLPGGLGREGEEVSSPLPLGRVGGKPLWAFPSRLGRWGSEGPARIPTH